MTPFDVAIAIKNWRMVEETKNKSREAFKPFASPSQWFVWTHESSDCIETPGYANVFQFDTRGKVADESEWENQRRRMFGAYYLLPFTNNELDKSAGMVFLDFIARLLEADMWVIPYAIDFAAKRLNMAAGTCQKALKWLRENKFMVYCAGGNSSGGDIYDPLRYCVNIEFVLKLISSIDTGAIQKIQAERTMERIDKRIIPESSERKEWVKLGGFRAMQICALLGGVPVSASQLAQATRCERRTVTEILRGMEAAGKVKQLRRQGWIIE